MKIVVLDGYAVNPGDLSWEFLEKYGEVFVYDKTPDADCAEKCKNAEVVFTNRAKITAEILDACPTIKYVSALGTGYDMIDISACEKRMVKVVNIPDYSAASVAQLTIQFLIALYSDLDGISNIVKEGKWTGIPGYRYDFVRYGELAGGVLGLIGCGSIGRRVAAIASALGMEVLAWTPNAHSDTETVKFVGLSELLSRADVISFHCPLNEKTRGMVNADFLSKTKHGVKLINTSRGAVFNESDVADALRSGRVSAAAVDVLAVEPALRENPLLSAPNCIITPHIAWATKAARMRLLDVIDRSIASYVSGEGGINRIC